MSLSIHHSLNCTSTLITNVSINLLSNINGRKLDDDAHTLNWWLAVVVNPCWYYYLNISA